MAPKKKSKAPKKKSKAPAKTNPDAPAHGAGNVGKRVAVKAYIFDADPDVAACQYSDDAIDTPTFLCWSIVNLGIGMRNHKMYGYIMKYEKKKNRYYVSFEAVPAHNLPVDEMWCFPRQLGAMEERRDNWKIKKQMIKEAKKIRKEEAQKNAQTPDAQTPDAQTPDAQKQGTRQSARQAQRNSHKVPLAAIVEEPAQEKAAAPKKTTAVQKSKHQVAEAEQEENNDQLDSNNNSTSGNTSKKYEKTDLPKLYDMVSVYATVFDKKDCQLESGWSYQKYGFFFQTALLHGTIIIAATPESNSTV